MVSFAAQSELFLFLDTIIRRMSFNGITAHREAEELLEVRGFEYCAMIPREKERTAFRDYASWYCYTTRESYIDAAVAKSRKSFTGGGLLQRSALSGKT